MKILDVYAKEPNEYPDFKGHEIDHMPIEELAASDATLEYDLVVAWHSLQTQERENVPATVQLLADAAKDRGEVWIITPSLEWALQQIKLDKPSPLFTLAMFGSEDKPHRTGFSIAWLRNLAEGAGLITRSAVQEAVKMGSGEIAIQNVVIGAKVLR